MPSLYLVTAGGRAPTSCRTWSGAVRRWSLSGRGSSTSSTPSTSGRTGPAPPPDRLRRGGRGPVARGQDDRGGMGGRDQDGGLFLGRRRDRGRPAMCWPASPVARGRGGRRWWRRRLGQGRAYLPGHPGSMPPGWPACTTGTGLVGATLHWPGRGRAWSGWCAPRTTTAYEFLINHSRGHGCSRSPPAGSSSWRASSSATGWCSARWDVAIVRRGTGARRRPVATLTRRAPLLRPGRSAT